MAVDVRGEEILALEQRFWDCMRDKDGDAAASMTAEGSVIVGAQGVGSIGPAAMSQTMAHGTWTLTAYKFDESKIQIRFLADEIALIAYPVTEQLVVEGKSLTLQANDTSVWIRREGTWVCAMHTESLVGDPFGRDRNPAG